MAEAFEPITTQEAFEAAVADRLAPYADYNDLKAQNEALAGQVAELNTRCQTYETDALKTRVAHEVGLPFDLAGRLTGSAESAASVQDEYYRFFLERLMDGLEGLTTSQR